MNVCDFKMHVIRERRHYVVAITASLWNTEKGRDIALHYESNEILTATEHEQARKEALKILTGEEHDSNSL